MKILHNKSRYTIFTAILAILATLALAGCPTLPGGGTGGDIGQALYDAGFVVGFDDDTEYWQGYDDSWDTRDGGDIFYTGGQIPFLDELSYDAGYYDGIWYAYNDGYFVAYDYAFTIGFSEGYDAAFHQDWPDFLLNDVHDEWLDGGFTDGYNDGFSEGRILGASDYEDGLPFDWLDAMLWYKEPPNEFGEYNDIILEIEDTNGQIYQFGTGQFGPVVLYAYGADPLDLINGKSNAKRAIRSQAKQNTQHNISYRNLPSDIRNQLSTRNTQSPRGGRQLTLTTTWLQRVDQYNDAFSKNTKANNQRGRAVR